MQNSKDIFDRYFSGNPAFCDLEKATYAYHMTARMGKDAHSFLHTFKSLSMDTATDFQLRKFKQDRCEWCGRSREEIRWDSNLPSCSERPVSENRFFGMTTGEVIHSEEESYFALIERAKNGSIQRVLDKKFNGELTAKALFYVQNTLGYEPDIVSLVLDLEVEDLMVEYESLMDAHRRKSGDFCI